MATTQGIKLDDKTQDRLKALAEKRNRSPHWIMKTAIEGYLEREEGYEREKSEDMKRWERYQLTGTSVDQESVETLLTELAKDKR